MLAFACCAILETGVWLSVVFVLCFVAVVCIVCWLIYKLSRKPGSITIDFTKFGISLKTKGPNAVTVLILVVIAAAGYLVYDAYNTYHNMYSVAVDSPGGVSLGRLRAKYQEDTTVTIAVSDRARGFLVKGTYVGSCVPSFFDAICRQYASELSCKTSYLQKRMTIDLAN